ncbi:response regulator with CheY-like receiver domain and winged-helix DNA-binding domain [Desulfosporosinus orientis DSM 765]|uniref:Stage 0 sporulation protein A homolog n=1 Tax=Desulfosporosinus orientis (strain ATCC 19365 / DSM 765 / NCIMB 8382 / VKM B-1628 / Singapore I) TaxID=768706 RepID=G7WIV6_DESOD|nr:response regulator transcription factor [Desulfosporosinus orientis]AET69681.1 response regulator with CheY-like receiver domain and winged-helix DNA-binding domain [Desulfosporosinus orientis DSM 765]
MFHVYLVEPDMQLNHLLCLYLKKEGFMTTSFFEGEKAINNIDKNPHLWIVDRETPAVDGFAILSEVKSNYPDRPVIMISEQNSNVDRIFALEMGCDDYLPKPFLPKELVLRVKRILEHIHGSAKNLNRIMIYGDYKIDEIVRMVQKDDEIINLTSKEFDLLLLFVKNLYRTFSREQVLKYVWNDVHLGSERSVDDLVRRLRRKMRNLRIESIYSYGYRLLPSQVRNTKTIQNENVQELFQ